MNRAVVGEKVGCYLSAWSMQSKGVWIGLVALLMSGCSVKMMPLDPAEVYEVAQEDRQLARETVPPLTVPLSLEEAIARALKHNLDHRTRILEQGLAAGQFEAGRYDMLPKLLANAGYSSRNNDSIRNSIDSITGLPSLANPAISSDRSHTSYDIGLTWNMLDFGASYYTSKQNADRVLIASERRRKAMHSLIQNVRATYWRAVAAECLMETVRQTIAEAESALADSRRISAGQMRSPQDAWRFQRTLLENLRLLEGVVRELNAAKIELASLIGLEPGTALKLEEPTSPRLPFIDFPVEQMEDLALLNNADLREHHYNVRIAADETRKALLGLMPGITLSYAYHGDDDSFLINQNWTQAGVRVSYNLFNLLAAPSKMRASEMAEQVAEARRMALQMSVLTQVHLSRHQYYDAQRQFGRSEEIFEVDHNLARFAAGRAKTQTAGQLDSISANVTYILSSVRRYHALAKMHEAASRVQATLGLEPQIASLDDISLTELTDLVTVSLNEWTAASDVAMSVAWCMTPMTPIISNAQAAAKEATAIAERIEFLYGRAELTEASKAMMQPLIDRLLSIDGYIIEIQGHTDSAGSNAYNMSLSQRRAEAVGEILHQGGIEMGRTLAIGRGASSPIADNNTEEGRARNRRVEFHLREQ